MIKKKSCLLKLSLFQKFPDLELSKQINLIAVHDSTKQIIDFGTYLAKKGAKEVSS